MKLSKELESFRCDRPSEWKMDDFIQKAKLLEAYVIEANEKAEHFEREMYLLEDIRDALAEKYRELENEMYNLKQQLTPSPKCFITNQGMDMLTRKFDESDE